METQGLSPHSNLPLCLRPLTKPSCVLPWPAFQVCLIRERDAALHRLAMACEAHTVDLAVTCDEQNHRIGQLEGAALEAEHLLGRPCNVLRSGSPPRAVSPPRLVPALHLLSPDREGLTPRAMSLTRHIDTLKRYN